MLMLTILVLGLLLGVTSVPAKGKHVGIFTDTSSVPTSNPTSRPTSMPTKSTTYIFNCPSGTFVTQFIGRAGGGVDAIGVKCSDGAESILAGGTGGNSISTTLCPQGILKKSQITGGSGGMGQFTSFCGSAPSSIGANKGPWAGTISTTQTCLEQGVFVGIKVIATGFIGNSGVYVKDVSMSCGTVPTSNEPTVRPSSRPTNRPTSNPSRPTSMPTKSTTYVFNCPSGTFVTQFIGRAGGGVDAIGVKCSDGAESILAGGTGGNSTSTTLCPQGILKKSQITGGSGGMGQFTSFCDSAPSSIGANKGPWAGTISSTQTCLEQGVFVGITVTATGFIGNSGVYVKDVSMRCATVPFTSNEPTVRPSSRPTNRPTELPSLRPTNLPTSNPTSRPTPMPTKSTTSYIFNCPSGTFVTQFIGRAGGGVDAIGVKCSNGAQSILAGGTGGDPVSTASCPQGILEKSQITGGSGGMGQFTSFCGSASSSIGANNGPWAGTILTTQTCLEQQGVFVGITVTATGFIGNSGVYVKDVAMRCATVPITSNEPTVRPSSRPTYLPTITTTSNEPTVRPSLRPTNPPTSNPSRPTPMPTTFTTEPPSLRPTSPSTVFPQESFSITLLNIGSSPWSVEVVTALNTAKAKWESIITTGFPDIPSGLIISPNVCGNTNTLILGPIDDITILVNIKPIDGVNNILAGASPCFLRNSNKLPFLASIIFDSDDISNMINSGSFVDVALHEMGHCLGFGVAWNISNPSNSTDTFDTYFPGPNSIAAFNTAGGTAYTLGSTVPVANVGGPGSINSHWRESVFNDELMTPFIALGGTSPLSIVTIGAMEDLGYSVNYTSADPWTYVPPDFSIGSHTIAFSSLIAETMCAIYLNYMPVLDQATNTFIPGLCVEKLCCVSFAREGI